MAKKPLCCHSEPPQAAKNLAFPEKIEILHSASPRLE
jgi:hypothetical protein